MGGGGEKVACLDGQDLNYGGGGTQTPKGRLCRPAYVPPIGVGLHAAYHPGPQGQFQAGGEGPLGGIPPGPLPRGGDCHAREGNHSISSQVLGPSNSRPYHERSGKLNGIVNGHRTPCHGPMRTRQVLLQGPHTTTEGRPSGDKDAEGA